MIDVLLVHQPIDSKLNTSAAFRYLVQTQHLDRLRVKKNFLRSKCFMDTQPEYGCESATRHTYYFKNYTFQEYAFTPVTKDEI